MDFKEAVALALAGHEQGFGVLYENTYKSKYYLALQYMKKEEDAQDVLQEAYIKAFSNLDKLENPEAFSGWLGTIVANTAKNMLAKKSPMLFSDVAVNAEEESFEYQIEDDDIANQPELSYTRQETQELVHELIGSLSEEQRLCVLMFHIEGASISEIAAALNCSDNTVKSRLNYGRKNLKVKAEELQKKGYKLYSIAPLPLLLLLLRSDQTALAMDGSFTAAGKVMARYIFPRIPILQNGNAFTKTQQSTGQNARAVTKTGFLHTTAGKITAAVIGICIMGGAAFYGVTQFSPNVEEQTVQETTEPEITSSEPSKANEPETPEPEVPKEKEVKDEEYPSLIAGNLTKQELAFVLAYGPEEIPEQGFEEMDYQKMMEIMCYFSDQEGSPILNYGWDERYRSQFSVNDINRLFSSFTDYRFTEDNDSDLEYGIDVDGEVIRFHSVTPGSTASVEITSATYTETEMKVKYTFEKSSPQQGVATLQKRAILQPDNQGMYRIVKIEAATEDTREVSQTGENTAPSEIPSSNLKELYKGVLQSVQNHEADDGFRIGPELIEGYEYCLADMNNDGIQELIVGAVFVEDVFEAYDIQVYSSEPGGSEYQLKKIDGDLPVLGLSIPSDGNGLYHSAMSRGTGLTNVYRITIESGTLTNHTPAELEFTMGEAADQQFRDSVTALTWFDVSDLSGMDAIH